MLHNAAIYMINFFYDIESFCFSNSSISIQFFLDFFLDFQDIVALDYAGIVCVLQSI